VLVGGTANLPGIAEFTKEKLQLPARVGELHAVGGLVDTLSSPATFTAAGLMLLDMLLLPDFHEPTKEHPNTKIFTSLSKLVKSVHR
jgi:cell division ATPase FtsA